MKPGLIELIREGTTYHDQYGRIDLTEQELDTALANFYRRPSMKLAVKHGKHEAGTPAAGWITGLTKATNDKGGYSLFATVDWTDDASNDIKARKYLYISPEFHKNFIDKDTGDRQGFTLLGAALLNDPQLDEMREVFAFSQGTEMEQMKEIAKRLGLTEDSTMEQVLACIDEMSSKMSDMEGIEIEFSQTRESVTSLTQRVEVAESQVVELTARAESAEAENVELSQKLAEATEMAQATKAELDEAKAAISLSASQQWVDGFIVGEQRKLTPAQREQFVQLHQKDPGTAEAIVATLPPLEALGTVTGIDHDGTVVRADLSQNARYEELKKIHGSTKAAEMVAKGE